MAGQLLSIPKNQSWRIWQSRDSRFVSSVMVKFHSGVSAAVRAGLEGMYTQPESKPPARGSQGSVKLD